MEWYKKGMDNGCIKCMALYAYCLSYEATTTTQGNNNNDGRTFVKTPTHYHNSREQQSQNYTSDSNTSLQNPEIQYKAKYLHKNEEFYYKLNKNNLFRNGNVATTSHIPSHDLKNQIQMKEYLQTLKVRG